MGSHANPVQTRAETSVVFELTLVPAAGAGADSRRNKTFALDRSLRIGSDQANHIVIDGEGVGAFHGRFFPGPVAPVFVLSDSAALINGLEIRGSAGLIAGDVLSIGDYEVRVSARGAHADRSAGAAAKWQLILDDDVASVQVAGDVIIGSEADCGIRLQDAGIAAHHAQLVLRDGTLWLRDFSDGATFVNDDPVSGACRLEPDDRVRIGPHRFRAARQMLASVEPATAASVTPAPPDLDSVHSEVPATRDLPMAADAKDEARPQVLMADAPVTEKPVSAPPVTEQRVPEVPVPAPPVAKAPVPEVPVSAPPVAKAPVPEVPVSAPPVAKAPVSEVPVSAPPVAKAPVPEVPVSAPPVAKAPVPEVPVSAPPVAKAPVPDVPAAVAPVARKPEVKKPEPKKPVAKKPVADTPEAVWEFDSLEMPVSEIHFELVEPERPRGVPEPIPQPVPPPRVSRPVVAKERRVVSVRSVRVEPRVSMRQPARPRAAEPTGGTTLWRVTGLLAVLTLAWAVAMRPPASDGLVGPAVEQTLADARERTVAAARALQTAIIDRWRATVANTASTPSETASTASAPPMPGVSAPALDQIANGEVAQPTAEIIELQRNAATGDATAIARLKELGDLYAALASSALARGDQAAAKRHLAMVALMGSTPRPAEGTVAASTGTAPRQSQGRASSVDALAQEARQLQSQGAVFAPAQRNVVSVLVEALTRDATHEDARRHLNLVIGSLNGRVGTLIANHQFRAAGSLLAQLADDGIPVLSNGNVRDRPPFLDAAPWRSLAVSSLLVEADALIQQGLIATAGNDNAISRLESATRIDPSNPLIEDMRAKSAGMLFLDAQRAAEHGSNAEAKRLTNLANYVRDGFGA